MDRKLQGRPSLKSEPGPEPRSAFEISLGLEFQVDPLPQGKVTPKAGDLCPNCHSANMDYDGMLNLSCPRCGYNLAGCFT